MKNWPFRYQTMLISSIPALVVWLMLTISNLYITWSTLDHEQTKHGEALVGQIAPSCEFAIFSGDMTLLDQLLEKVITTSDIQWVEVYDMEFHLLTHVGKLSSTAMKSKTKTFTAPIYSSILDINGEPGTTEDLPSTIGSVSIGLSTSPMQRLQHDLLVRSMWSGAITIILIILLAIFISRGLSSTFHNFRITMRKIASGDFSPPAEGLPTQGELGELTADLQKMVQSLKRNREHALAAYELLEIKNRENEKLLQKRESE